MPASSTRFDSLESHCRDWHGCGTGGLRTSVAVTASVSIEVSVLTTFELLFVIAPSLSFLPGGLKVGGANKSSSCIDTSVQAFRLSWDYLAISLFALWFWANASLGEGFALLKESVPGNGGATTSSKDALVSDESSSYGLETTFFCSWEQLCRMAEEGQWESTPSDAFNSLSLSRHRTFSVCLGNIFSWNVSGCPSALTFYISFRVWGHKLVMLPLHWTRRETFNKVFNLVSVLLDQLEVEPQLL